MRPSIRPAQSGGPTQGERVVCPSTLNSMFEARSLCEEIARAPFDTARPKRRAYSG